MRRKVVALVAALAALVAVPTAAAVPGNGATPELPQPALEHAFFVSTNSGSLLIA
jgi:hypothetical protein